MNSNQFLLSKGDSLIIFADAAIIASAFLISLLLLIILIPHLAESTSPLDILCWCLMLTIELHHLGHVNTRCCLVVRDVSCDIASRSLLLRVQYGIEITSILIISRRLSGWVIPLTFLFFFLHLFKITIYNLIRS